MAQQILVGLPSIIAWIFRAYEMLIIVYALLTFFPRIYNSGLGVLIRQVVEPFLNLISRIIPTRIGFIDLSPLIAIVLVQFLEWVVLRILIGIIY